MVAAALAQRDADAGKSGGRSPMLACSNADEFRKFSYIRRYILRGKEKST